MGILGGGGGGGVVVLAVSVGVASVVGEGTELDATGCERVGGVKPVDA